jgi:hypothetical protein
MTLESGHNETSNIVVRRESSECHSLLQPKRSYRETDSMGAWLWEAIETVMQIATTTDAMQAAGAMQQGEDQAHFAAQRLGPPHRTLRMQVIVSNI